jgi:hypothetical protein
LRLEGKLLPPERRLLPTHVLLGYLPITFLEQYGHRILGALSCFDRVLLGGYLSLESGWTVAELFAREHR